MGCYSREFTLAVLEEKTYFNRLSAHLIEQLIELSCDDLARFERAIDALEGIRGESRTKQPGSFRGVLAGYSHIHYLHEEWQAANFARSQRVSSEQSLDQMIDQVAERIVKKGVALPDAVDDAIEKFANRMSESATGHWLIFEERPTGNFYLAVNPHALAGSPEELALKALLDGIAR